ncbi:MAG: ABC transporter permease [Chloroflexota bacterium]|nr:ABC transporter permease [Chloroflexota bacterium]
MATRGEIIQPTGGSAAIITFVDDAAPRTGKRRRARIPLPVWFFIGFLLLVILIAVFAPILAPYNPTKGTLAGRLHAPAFLSAEKTYPLGSDQIGRDVLSRMLYGARISLTVGFLAVLIGGCFGSLLGLVAGYVGGWLDETIMTLGDMQLAFPFILLAIAVIAVLGPSLRNLIIVVGISGWVTYARIARAQVLAVREREFITAERAIGATASRILFRHILPNIAASLIVVGSLDLARTIILESTLSFLGLGVQPPTASWGGMLGEGREYLNTAWWISTFPGILLTLTTISVSRIGDWLRDVLDPTMRNV